MRNLKKYIFIGMTALLATSCSDFLDTAPKDALSPVSTWQTQDDADKFLVGCYNNWQDQYDSGWGWDGFLLYWDGTSDFGYDQFSWEGYTPIGNGTVTASSGRDWYDFSRIRRVNELLANIDKCTMPETAKKDIMAQARWIRAYRYFLMNWNYGGVPIIESYATAEEAMVPRKSEQEVKEYIEKELDELVNDINVTPAARGRIAKGAALALRMREALYYGDYATAKDRAEKIIALNQYELDPDYANLFNVAGQDSKEIILAVQAVENDYYNDVIGRMYNNADGGWSSIVPSYGLIDTYEMANGLTKDEPGSGYDPTHPFNNRDPRMAMTVIYPGCDYINGNGKEAIYNSLDKTINGASNANFYTAADNSSKTGLTWGKYLAPMNQYPDIWNTTCQPIVFRYAEVLLTYCEAANELNGPSAQVYTYLNMVRNRVGMPDVDEAKYNTKEKLRELIRRERGVEFAGEGIRRADILRWKDASGKMLAETLLNCTLERQVGTVSMDKSVAPGMRATINVNASAADKKIEDRVFKTTNRYLPIPQGALDANLQLKQNDGY